MKNKIILFLIILLAFFLRLYHLNTLPPALFADEVDAGYQALIFNQSHSDYYGNSFPVHFHSFADWRTSLYIYSIAAAQHFTSNPDLAVRLPSVIFSLFSIFFFYLLTGSKLAVFLMAISPWSIHYGRTGFEVSGMIMVILGALFFWKKYTQNSSIKNLLLSIFFFALSPYFYSTSKLFLLILAVLIFFLWFSKIIKIPRTHLVVSVVFTLILMLPLLIDTLKGHAGYRFSYISIFSDPQISKNIDYLRYQDVYTDHFGQVGISPSLSSKLAHNKYILIATTFFKNYFSSFSADFLFISGDQNSRHGFGNHGLLYFLDFFMILFGIINIIKNRRSDRFGLLFVWILFLAPIPFALTRDSLGPHATRLILMLPSLIYLSYQGILYLNHYLPKIIYLLIPLYFLSLFFFWHYYTLDYPQESAMSWHSGMKEAVLAAKKYSLPIYFSNAYEPFTPFFLYYQPYTSVSAPATKLNYEHNPYFDGTSLDKKYYFGHLNLSGITADLPTSLFVVSDVDKNLVPASFKLVETISKRYINAQNFYLYSNEK